VWLARRWEWPVLAGCVVLAYAWIVAVHLLDLPDRMLLWLPGHLDWFAVGMASPRWPAAACPAGWAAGRGLGHLLGGGRRAAVPARHAGRRTAHAGAVPGGAAVLKEAGYALVAGCCWCRRRWDRGRRCSARRRYGCSADGRTGSSCGTWSCSTRSTG
jgi:hypothetical protein